MERAVSNVIVVETPEAWDAVTSIVRIEMLTLFEGKGPSTVSELAESMGRPADGLYHHIHVLERGGLVEQIGTAPAPSGRRSEAVYGLTGHKIRLSIQPEHFDRRSRATKAVFNKVHRLLDRAFRLPKFTEPEQRVFVRSNTGVLSGGQERRLHELLEEIESIFRDAREQPVDVEREEGQRVTTLFVIAPVEENDRRLRKKSARGNSENGKQGG